MNWEKTKVYVLNTVIGIIFAGALSLIPFYYSTINILAQHSEKINGNTKGVSNNAEEVDDLDKTIRDNKLAPIVIQGEMKVIKKDIEYIKKKQDKHEETLDEIRGLLIDLIKQNGN